MVDVNNLAERLARLSAAKRALLEKKIREAGHDVALASTIIPRGERELAPLSFAQQRLWFLQQLEPESAAYHESTALRLLGELDVQALQSAINAIIARHEVLRTVFVLVDDHPMQRILKEGIVEITCADLRHSSDEERDIQARDLMRETFVRPFDLSRDLLVRPLLVRLDEREHLLLIVRHHIASDGWSSGIFRQELSVFYSAFVKDETPALADLKIQYADYAEWQRQYLTGNVLDSQLAYWRKKLADVPVLELPTDRPRGLMKSTESGKESVPLPHSLSEKLRILSRGRGVTLFMTLAACFNVLLHRYTDQDDIAVGSIIAGRNRAETEGLIGFFVNTLVLRTDVSGNPTFNELLTRTRNVILEAFDHQDLPFERVVEEINPERSRSGVPLLQVMFALQNIPSQPVEMSRLVVTPVEVDASIGKFDLYVALFDRDGELTLRIDYRKDLFDSATIRRMAGHFQALLEDLVAESPYRRTNDDHRRRAAAIDSVLEPNAERLSGPELHPRVV